MVSFGKDGLSHPIEVYVPRGYDAKPAPEYHANRPGYNGRSNLTDLFARAAIEHIGASLRGAVNDGKYPEARRRMVLWD